VERGTARTYLNTLARGVYSLQFPPVVDIDWLINADAITTKRLTDSLVPAKIGKAH
jgi:hypothetical protein